MVEKYNKRQGHDPIRFSIGDYITVFIPRQDRASTDDRRLPARILSIPHRDRYQLQTTYGILKNHYGTRHLDRVPEGVIPIIPDNATPITLRAAATAASRNPTGSARSRCNCKSSCSTNRCGCYKAKRKCTKNCHPRGLGDIHCSNTGGSDVDDSDNSGSSTIMVQQ